MVTPQMVHDIFEEHPVVAKAYNENVPNQASVLEPVQLITEYITAFRRRILEAVFSIKTL